ncbi:MAG: hypothetical protein RIE73_02845 [Coleofasciculus sp. C1-SOL-03]|uniref:hypothetical protein n=1 Tax=Coleofasciculus sp. C1-SOL-03 TaxID=3069522 RepID=UPI0032F41FF3
MLTSTSNLSPLTVDMQKAAYRLSVGRNDQAISLRLLLDDIVLRIPQRFLARVIGGFLTPYLPR